MEIVAPVITAILGFLGGLITPWVKYKVHIARELKGDRKAQISEWRAAIENVNLNDDHTRKKFTSSSTYSSLRQRMQPSAVEKFEKDRTLNVGGSRGHDVRKNILLDEVARLERKWKLL